MDLTRLYNLTTPELRDEAERLGVDDTYAMSRGQLIHAIRSRRSGTQTEGLFGKVLGFAKWALQAAQEEPIRAPEDDAEDPSVARRSSEPPMPTVTPPPEPAPGPSPASESSTQRLGAAAFGSEPAHPGETATVPGEESGPPSRPPAGVFSRSASVFEEPFPTRTMARILADQGHFKRSLAIYATLLSEQPGDRELSAEADDVRTRSRTRRSQVH